MSFTERAGHGMETVRAAIKPGGPARRGLSEARYRAAVTARRVGAAERALPSFLIIGTQKGGTTSLHAYLAQHPDVGEPVIKEIQYFSLNYPRGEGWYRTHFPVAGRGRVTFEATPYYLFHPGVPRRAAETIPDAKLISLLRDPVGRAHSHHNHQVDMGFEPLDFETAIAREPERLAGEEERMAADPRYRSFAHQHFSYVSRGRYAEQLERWYAHFPAEQILVMPSEDLFADPAATLHRVQDWLGLSRHTPETLSARGARRYSSMETALRDELRGHFAADSARLEGLTGVRLPWV